MEEVKLYKLYAYAGESGEDPHEVVIDLSYEDMSSFSAVPHRDNRTPVTVTDQVTGRAFTVRRTACGLGCFCAAQADPVEPE